jgi:hypothetical protein
LALSRTTFERGQGLRERAGIGEDVGNAGDEGV